MRHLLPTIAMLACSWPPSPSASPPPDDDNTTLDDGPVDHETAATEPACLYPIDTIHLASSVQREVSIRNHESWVPATSGRLYWQMGTVVPEIWLTLRGTLADEDVEIDLDLLDAPRLPIHIRYAATLTSPSLWDGAFTEIDRSLFTVHPTWPEEEGPHQLKLVSMGMSPRHVPEYFILQDDDTWCSYPATLTWTWQDERRPACHGGATYDVIVQPAEDQVCPFLTPDPEGPVFHVPGGDTADIPPCLPGRVVYGVGRAHDPSLRQQRIDGAIPERRSGR